MSYFASALNELLEEENMTQAEASRRSGITAPQFSRWISAELESISSEDFERLCRVFTKPSDQAKLLAARLRDIVSGPDVPGAKLIQIKISGSPAVTTLQEDPHPYKLPPKQNKDIQTIVEHMPHNRLIREMIASMAAHLRRK